MTPEELTDLVLSTWETKPSHLHAIEAAWSGEHGRVSLTTRAADDSQYQKHVHFETNMPIAHAKSLIEAVVTLRADGSSMLHDMARGTPNEDDHFAIDRDEIARASDGWQTLVKRP